MLIDTIRGNAEPLLQIWSPPPRFVIICIVHRSWSPNRIWDREELLWVANENIDLPETASVFYLVRDLHYLFIYRIYPPLGKYYCFESLVLINMGRRICKLDDPYLSAPTVKSLFR
jgi:hypothetical protein